MQSSASTSKELPARVSKFLGARNRINSIKAWKGPAASFALCLVFILPLAVAASSNLRSKIRSEAEITAKRAEWYLRSSQWRADVRTVVSTFEFIMDRDAGATGETTAPTNPPGTGQSQQADFRPGHRFPLL